MTVFKKREEGSPHPGRLPTRLGRGGKTSTAARSLDYSSRHNSNGFKMSYLTIEVWDATGNKKQVVEVPADAAVNRLIAVLVEKMNLPRHSPDGQMMSYKFHHRASGRQLLDTETLSTAGVHEGDILRLQPEITAGSDIISRQYHSVKIDRRPIRE